MAISPPSDLVLDVVRAANPVDVEAAQARLKTSRMAFAANSLAEKGAGFGAAVDILSSAASKAGLGNVAPATVAAGTEVPTVYKQFEASVLQNFVKSMLPSDSEAVYGKGNAGEIWKSMLAEQIGDVMSEGGGIGIAQQMYSKELAAHRGTNQTSAIANDDDRRVAMNMVTDLERRTLGISSTHNNEKIT
ncbi:MAG: rod-binding protein [Allorhizobium sp.]